MSAQHSKTVPTARLLESTLAVAAAALVCGASVFAASLISRSQPLWPLPGMYLVEVAALTVASGLAILFADTRRADLMVIAWFTLGVLCAFILLGVLSVGYFYVPGAAALAAAAVMCDTRRGAPLARHLAVALAGIVAQVALMLGMLILSGARP